MRIRVISTEREFDSIEEEWIAHEIRCRNSNITSSYQWQRVWWSHFGRANTHSLGYDKKLSVLLLLDDSDRLIAIAPLCVARRKLNRLFSYRSLEFISQQWAATYLDLICESLSDEEQSFLFHWIGDNIEYDLIDLRYIPQDTGNFDLALEQGLDFSACPEIEGSEYDQARQKYYSRNLKHKLNRIHNKISREDLNIDIRILEGEDILYHFDEIVRVSISKESSHKHSLYRDERKAGFMRDIISAFGTQSKCAMMFFDGVLCSYNLGFNYSNVYFAVDASYSRGIKELSNFSIGNLVYDRLVQSCLSPTTTRFCFGTGIDSYKLRFTKQLKKLYSIQKEGRSLFGGKAFMKIKNDQMKRKSSFQSTLSIQIPDHGT